MTPAIVLPTSAYGGGTTSIQFIMFALLWTYNSNPWTSDAKFQFLNPSYMITSFPFTLPMLIFAYGVVRYIQNRISFAKFIGSAILSIIIPLITAVIYFIIVMTTGGIGYAGPVPIHIIIGLLLVKKGKQPEITPWDGEEESPWWEE
ncbi:MAG: hypothetical protein K9W43_06480 [Candidatus Thorarchaeota archaeon]|nr:hypothetical protein [Candidatus Thorarchaeota archaeon]